MTTRPLAPVIPSSAVPAGRQRARAAGGRPLPLARPVPAPPAPEDVVYGIGRIDASGRIADRAVTTALGWRGGDRLLMTLVKADAVQRRNGRGGRSAQEHLVAALRCLYRHTEEDGLISERDNPARKVGKPRRLPFTRRAVADARWGRSTRSPRPRTMTSDSTR